MNEQQKQYIKNAIERADNAWNEIENVSTYLKEEQGSRPAGSHERQELQKLAIEFDCVLIDLEPLIEHLERLLEQSARSDAK